MAIKELRQKETPVTRLAIDEWNGFEDESPMWWQLRVRSYVQVDLWVSNNRGAGLLAMAFRCCLQVVGVSAGWLFKLDSEGGTLVRCRWGSRWSFTSCRTEVGRMSQVRNCKQFRYLFLPFFSYFFFSSLIYFLFQKQNLLWILSN